MSNLKKIISKYPLLVFLLALTLLFIVIFVGTQIRKQKNDSVEPEKHAKNVVIFDTKKDINSPIDGEVDRTDTVLLRATASGIVTKALRAGDSVYRGKEIIRLSDTYSGSSQASAAAAIANRNAKFQDETIGTQRDLLKIEKKELKKTKDHLASITRKQHYLQERSIELAHDTAHLQATQANAALALFQTVSPLKGTLEEVTVSVGDNVERGQVLAILKATNQDDIRITAYVGAERAAHIDVNKKITASYKGKEIPLEIVHISQNSNGAQAYTLTFRTSKESLGNIAEGAFVKINLPLKSENDILIPLDSVHFSTNTAEVYVLENDTAHIKKITLGEIIGSYIIVTDGLNENAKIIMDRNITDGELIQVEK